MTSRFLVPTLAALALAPAVQAFEIAGDAWALSIEPRLQSRIEFASASDAAGDDYDIWERRSTDNPQEINFSVRRARLYFKGKSEDGWKFNFTIMADNIGRQDDRDSDNVAVRYANVGKEFKSGDIKHYVQFGLDKHSSVMADIDSSSKHLFPTGRLAAEYTGPRSIGLDYRLASPIFGISTGIADEAGDDNNDWHVYGRVWTGLTEEWTLTKRSESFLGKEGFGHQLGLGFDLRADGSTASDGTEEDGYSLFTLDYLIHYHQITALVDLAFISLGEADGDTSGMIATIQAGYAFPQADGTVIEPALRVQFVDNDSDDDDEAGVLNREGGASGVYVDAGVNYYLDGHANKLQAALQSYSPEEGDGNAVAFRLAHQLEF